MHARALTPLAAALAAVFLAAAAAPAPSALHMPWREAGWSEGEAAAHLLDRFAFGARPGDVEKVVAMGLDRWMERQLAADLPDRDLDRRLARLDALEMSAAEMARQFPRPPRLLAEARRAGVVEGRGEPGEGEEMPDTERTETRRAVMRWAREQGYRPERELLGQLMAQKLYRAVYAENQLAEVLVDFWFNHFNVSLTDNRTRTYLLAYERDAIRPHVLGKFRTMLGATAQHPAMLVYLDNAQSSAAEGTATLARGMAERPRGGRGIAGGAGGRRRPPEVRGGGAGGAIPELPEMQGANDAAAEPAAAAAAPPERRRRPRGLNENYARELLELHTLGVDGGYTQQDVVEVARAFTGWTLMPPGGMRRRAAQAAPARTERMAAMGYETNGAFLFRADLHDAGAKTVLGQRLPAGRGVEEGRQVLDLLAKHPATAKHLARKLAVRFVGDEPPPALVERLAAVYTQANGDLRRMVRALAESPEFWAKGARGAKIKSPFELAVSAVRALGAEVADPRGLLQWTAQMGQRLYAYSAPTGFPDRADAWVNTGSLLSRMNFGLQLASGGVRGVRFDLAALAGGREPATREEALAVYARLLLPGRALDGVIATLKPMVDDPELPPRVEAVGVILGSPEFQRR